MVIGMRISVPDGPARSAANSSRTLALLTALALALVLAVVVAPARLAAIGSGGGFVDHRNFVQAVREAFVRYWSSGDRDFSPDLERVVDYWFRFHVVKAVIAAILLMVLVALGVRLWKAFLRDGGLGAGRRAGLVSGGILVTMLALLSLVMVIANIQGALAPFSSLLPMLEIGAPHGELADSLDQVRQRLNDSLSTGGQPPAPLQLMINDFSWYHRAVAVVAAIVAVAVIGLSSVLWKRFARSADRRTRRVLGSFGVLTTLFSLLLIALAAGNTTVAADPAPALMAFFEGGW